MPFFQFDIDGGIRDNRLDDEPTGEKIRITEMRLAFQMQVNGNKQCKNCNNYIAKEFVKCPICNYESSNNNK